MTIPDELHPQYDLDYRKGRPNRYAGQIDWSQGVILLDNDPAPEAGSTLALDDRDEQPEVSQADLDRATFRAGLKPALRKRRVTILLDTGLVEYFKAQAGERGYQTLINETPGQAVERDDLEERLRRIIRGEVIDAGVRAHAQPPQRLLPSSRPNGDAWTTHPSSHAQIWTMSARSHTKDAKHEDHALAHPPDFATFA